jgi:acetate---CoA ligase (ADP-forming)
MGVLSPHHRSTTYLQELRDPTGLAGNVGIVSQSGAFCVSLLNDIGRFGFSHIVSSGNEAVLAAADYLEYLMDDPCTEVIGGFIETIRQPDRFITPSIGPRRRESPWCCSKLDAANARWAVTTHTGGTAGDSEFASELFRAYHAIEVTDLVEFTEVIALPRAQDAHAGGGSASSPLPAAWPR